MTRRAVRTEGSMRPAWRLRWLAIGLAAVACLVAVSRLWSGTAAGDRLDAALASPVVHGPPWWVREALSCLARPLLLYGVGALVAVLLLRAVGARRPRAVATALLVPAVSLALLGPVRDGWMGLGTDGFPSGHAVAGYALLVSAACLWPGREAPPQEAPRWRRLTARWWPVALWLLTALTVTVGNVTLHAHLPGDVIGAALLVTGVTGLLLGILAPRPVRGGAAPGRGTMEPP